MGLDYGTPYSATGTDDTDADYPGGKGTNASSLTAKDGFPFLANFVNDALGFFQAVIMKGARGRLTSRSDYVAEITGDPDNISASDYADGLQAIMDPIDPDVETYSASGNYVFGDLVKYYGSQYLCLVANGAATTVQNPIDDVNGDYWYELPTEKTLRGLAQVIKPFFLGVKPIFDYNDASYQMQFPFGQFRKGNYIIKYFAVIHDDSNIISSGDIAYNAMAQGTKGAQIATLSSSEYTMIDGKDCTLSAQGDLRPSSFGRQEDAMQRITGEAGGVWASSLSDSGALLKTAASGNRGNTASTDYYTLSFDSADSVSPNAAKTDDEETRMKNLQGGPLAEIVAEVVAVA